jgi:hypothetical protein
MFSLIRDVLIPAAPALVLIGSLAAPYARAQEGPSGDEQAALAATAAVGLQAMAGRGSPSADETRRTATADDVVAEGAEAPSCRRVDRIGKFTMRRCK